MDQRPSVSMITPTDIARLPGPGLGTPVKTAFSHDGAWIAWLHGPAGMLQRELHLQQVETGITERVETPFARTDEADRSFEEKLRRERTRDVGAGITQFSWLRGVNSIMVPTAHEVWLLDVVTQSWTRVLEVPDAVILDPSMTRDGKRIAWVQNGNLMIAYPGLSDSVTRVSPLAGQGVSYGIADYIAQEELGRANGYWWSPDGSQLAYVRVDERSIPPFVIAHLGGDDPYANEVHRYPFAGGANVAVELHVADLRTGDSTKLDLGDHEYLTRVQWSAHGDLYVQTQDRVQQQLNLLRFAQRATGDREVLLVETSPLWVNVHDMLRPLDSGEILWASERSGYMHLELRSGDGEVSRVLTSGEWPVDSLIALDETHRRAWFMAGVETPLERHLYELDLNTGAKRCITEQPGVHATVMSVAAGLVADMHSALDRPPQLDLLDLEGRHVRTLVAPDDPRIGEFSLSPPELTTVQTPDGATLHVAVFRPEGSGPFPVIDALYGGPHVQLVTNSWNLTGSLRAQYFRQEGVAVIVADGRGSARRGHAFEGAIQHDLGNIEVQDHVAVVRELIGRGIVDANRVGAYGWSYGGYLAAMCLARAPETYRAVVSGAPVTHWAAYDTCYSERYMGLPQENPDGYERSSVIAHVASMRGQLLLVHGLLDENVHFRHTARLVDALHAAGIDHQLLLLPRERHLPRGHAERTCMEARITDFLLQELRSVVATFPNLRGSS